MKQHFANHVEALNVLTSRKSAVPITLWMFEVVVITFLAQPACAESLTLKNARLVDPEHHSIEQRDIIIKDGIVQAASGLKSDGNQGPNDKVIDLEGKWVIPGLIDLHVHRNGNILPDGRHEELGTERASKIMLYCGVVAFLDLAAHDYEKLFNARDRQRSDLHASCNESDIYCAGAAFGHWNMASAAEAPQVISNYIKKWKPDVIKLIYGRDTLDKPMLAAAVGAANKADVKTVVHIGSWQHAQDAIESGATCVTHFFDDEVIPDDIVEIWAKHKTVSIPTMAVQMDTNNFIIHPELVDAPLLSAIESPSMRHSYLNRKRFSEFGKTTAQWQKDDRDNDRASFKKLAHAHVLILAGSDTNNVGTFQGYSLHREIKIMQDCGYTPWQALAAGTTGAAKFLGRPSGISNGDRAEMVILNADPTKDVVNTQNIYAVVHHGLIIERNKLLKL